MHTVVPRAGTPQAPPTLGSLAAVVEGRSDVVHHDLYDAYGAEVYDDTVDSDVSEIRELSRLLRGGTGPVLELAAGSGRLTLPLLRLRRPLTAVELSGRMVELLRDRAARLRPAEAANLRVVQGDMARLDLAERFTSIVLGTASISLLDGAGRAGLLDGVRRHLDADGSFWLSVVTFAPGAEQASEPFDGHLDLQGRSGRTYRMHHHWRPGDDRRHVGVYELSDAPGPLHLCTSSPRIIDLPRLTAEVAEAGLAIVDRQPIAAGLPGLEEYYLQVRHGGAVR